MVTQMTLHVGLVTTEEAVKIINSPSIMPFITEDSHTGPYIADGGKHTVYLGCFKDHELCGVWICRGITSIAVECHACLLPSVFGDDATTLGELGKRWVWNNSGIQVVLLPIPACNSHAMAYAKRIGFNFSHIVPGLWEKHGTRQALHYYICERN